jgi:ditrans,polycis-polyprenyl diphosphate synthase
MLTPEVQAAMREVEELTSANSRCVLNVCLAYGGLEEMSNAINRVNSTGIRTREQLFAGLHIPQPVDLLLRTGESRLSNFMMLQCCENTQLHFLKNILWPELSLWNLAMVIFRYQTNIV